MENKIKQN